MSTPQYQSYGGTTARSNSSPATRMDVFKKPMDPELLAKVRRKKVKVLDEDEYVEKVEKIIERDFFPELEKLKAQSEYIEAKEKNDFATMSRLQEKFSGVRPNTAPPDSPATFETPQDYRRDQDPRRPDSSFGERSDYPSGGQASSSGENVDQEAEELTNLDKFLANHTSEDNESFREVQEETEKRHRMKNAWMYKDEKAILEEKSAQMSLPAIEDQANPPPRPLQVELWTYQNINSVFHNPDGVPLSHQEKIELAKKQKIITHDNTRLTKTPWKTDKQAEMLRREAERSKELVAGKVGADGKEISRPQTPMVNGFKMMSMAPSPALGVADSPLMTWGEVESTPYRLEGCDTPILPMSGAGFRIKDVPKRDQLAKELADKNSRYYRDRKFKALQQVKKSMKGGRLGTGASISNMSPAAQRLVSGKLGIRMGTDDMLRASYTPSPSARKLSTPTPQRIRETPSHKKTPSTGRSKAGPSGTPSASAISGAVDEATLAAMKARRKEQQSKESQEFNINTDNLLNISSAPKARARAQDFFMKPSD